jgi:hypothetical protein
VLVVVAAIPGVAALRFGMGHTVSAPARLVEMVARRIRLCSGMVSGLWLLPDYADDRRAFSLSFKPYERSIERGDHVGMGPRRSIVPYLNRLHGLPLEGKAGIPGPQP